MMGESDQAAMLERESRLETAASAGSRSQMESASRPYRVLMIAPTSFFSDYGGHIRILEETRVLQQMGHAVTIVTYFKGSNLPGLDIRRTLPLPWHTDYEVGSSRHKVAFDALLALQALREGLRVRPDIIHGHMHEGALIGGMLSRMLGVPLVFDFQGSLTSEMVDHHFLNRNGRAYATLYRLERFISRRLPQAVLTSSTQARDLLCEEFDVDPAVVYPLPDCADTQRFDPDSVSPERSAQLRQRHSIPADRIIVAYLGLLTDYQGIPHIIEAAKRLKATGAPAHFLVMGYPSVSYYRDQARRAGVSDVMTFTGKVEYRDAAGYLALGDIAIAPKLSATEGSGKLLNYMAMAQPVVAYDTPVNREYLADLGLYAPPGDIDVFTAQIQRLIDDPVLRQCCGEQLRERALRQFSWARAGEHIIDIYDRLTRR